MKGGPYPLSVQVRSSSIGAQVAPEGAIWVHAGYQAESRAAQQGASQRVVRVPESSDEALHPEGTLRFTRVL